MQKAKVSVEVSTNTEENIPFDHPNAPFNHQSIIKHLKYFPDRLNLKLDFGGSFEIPERIHNTGITSSWFIASDCFLVMQYPVTVLFSAIAVESVLNHDERLSDYRKKTYDSWITLSVKSLNKAQELGIDVSDLLDNSKNSKFVLLRNKVAHGDIAGYEKHRDDVTINPGFSYPSGWNITQSDAIEHLENSFNFLKKWGESNPTILLNEYEEIRTK